MKRPTYVIERVRLADCFPHVDAEAYSASAEDRVALANSVAESGVLSPIAVIRASDAGGGAPGTSRPTIEPATTVGGDVLGAPQYLVIDGIGRMEAMKTAGIEETDAQVFDLGDLSVAEFVVCKNAMMRKVTTGTRVMAYLKCHEREVLAAAEPEKYQKRPGNVANIKGKPHAVSCDTAWDKGWSSREIAERIGVSNHDVLAGIELLKATVATGESDAEGGVATQGRDGEGATNYQLPSTNYHQLDLFETVESVLRGETPIRRWKACAGGKVSKIGGKMAADYTQIALRTVKSWRGIFENWQTVSMDMRQIILADFRDALCVIPDDFRNVIELVICEKCKFAKAKNRK